MATTHTEAVLNKLSKSELVQLVLQTESSLALQITNLTNEVKDLLGYFKKLEADLAVTKNVNSKLMERVVQTERQCWANAQYSRRDTIEVLGIPSSIRDQDLEDKVRNVFREIGVNINERDIQACHRLREKDRTIVKFVNRKDCTNILRVKKDLKHLDPSKRSFSEGTKIFINESLCPYYRGIWNKCKKLRANQKLHQFYTINGIVRVKLEENSPPRSIIHMLDLANLFPDIEVDSL